MPDVSVQYLAYLHDLISLYHEKLSVVLSPRVAETFRDSASDSIIEGLGLEAHPASQVQDELSKWGIRSHIQTTAEGVSCEVECPYALSVHPLLHTKLRICPASFIALGAFRATNPSLRIVENQLTDNGARFILTKENAKASTTEHFELA